MVILCFLYCQLNSVVSYWGWFTLSHIWIVLWLSLSSLKGNYPSKLGDPVSALGGINCCWDWICRIPRSIFRTEKVKTKPEKCSCCTSGSSCNGPGKSTWSKWMYFPFPIFLSFFFFLNHHHVLNWHRKYHLIQSVYQIMANNPTEQIIMITNRLKCTNINCWAQLIRITYPFSEIT